MTPTIRLSTFVGGAQGPWRITRMETVVGEPLLPAARLSVGNIPTIALDAAAWILRGITSNERYVTHQEKQRLAAKSPPLGRPEATRARLIALRKNQAWWVMSQDERRSILEERSHHIEIGLDYLPAVARRLYHCRDLSDCAPFDFLTWFEHAPADSGVFDELVARLRASEEWTYIDREVDLRLVREL